MQKTSRILGLTCQVVSLLNLLIKLIHSVIILVGGATNYKCIVKTTNINSYSMELG